MAETYLRAALTALVLLGLLLVAEVLSAQLHPPVDTQWISSGIGPRETMGGSDGYHRGVDLVVPIGEPVYAAESGIVDAHWPPPGYVCKGRHGPTPCNGHDLFGGHIIIKHDRGIWTYSSYSHLSKSYVERGQYVYRGEVIGLSGDTGVVTGPHLHFEIWADPLRLIGGGD